MSKKKLVEALEGLPDVRVATVRAQLAGVTAPAIPVFVLATPSPGPFVLLSLVVNGQTLASNVPNNGKNVIAVPLTGIGARPWRFWWAAMAGANLAALGAFLHDGGAVYKLRQKAPMPAGIPPWTPQIVVP